MRLRAKQAQRRAVPCPSQVHHWAGGTELLTSATCSPQPAQVGLVAARAFNGG